MNIKLVPARICEHRIRFVGASFTTPETRYAIHEPNTPSSRWEEGLRRGMLSGTVNTDIENMQYAHSKFSARFYEPGSVFPELSASLIVHYRGVADNNAGTPTKKRVISLPLLDPRTHNIGLREHADSAVALGIAVVFGNKVDDKYENKEALWLPEHVHWHPIIALPDSLFDGMRLQDGHDSVCVTLNATSASDASAFIRFGKEQAQYMLTAWYRERHRWFITNHWNAEAVAQRLRNRQTDYDDMFRAQANVAKTAESANAILSCYSRLRVSIGAPFFQSSRDIADAEPQIKKYVERDISPSRLREQQRMDKSLMFQPGVDPYVIQTVKYT